MATQFGNQLVIDIANHLFRTSSWTAPTTLYLALYTTNPDANGDGGIEVTGGSYARVECGPGTGWWSAPVEITEREATQSSNVQTLRFPQPTANWGTITGIGLMDSLAGTIPLVLKTITQVVNAGDPMMTFMPGSLIFELK